MRRNSAVYFGTAVLFLVISSTLAGQQWTPDDRDHETAGDEKVKEYCSVDFTSEDLPTRQRKG